MIKGPVCDFPGLHYVYDQNNPRVLYCLVSCFFVEKKGRNKLIT